MVSCGVSHHVHLEHAALKVLRTLGLSAVTAAAMLVWSTHAARADDLAVSWNAPLGCPDREAMREGLAQRLGRTVTFGEDAALQFSGTITARDGGYALELQIRSPTSAQERQLRARSCNELARASLVIAALLLGAGPDATPAAPSGGSASQSRSTSERTWFLVASAGVTGDLGSLATFNLGPRLGFGLGLHATRLEVAALYLPPRELHGLGPNGSAAASLQLMAANLGVCQDFLGGPSLGPCLHVEAGELRGRGLQLASVRSSSATWLVVLAGARAAFRLFDAIYWTIEMDAGLLCFRANLAIRGAGTVHREPALIGRFSTGLEARF
jgi:hypothetical protein